ncbi:MAG TPA: glycosyltransferase [Gemmatimonadales bacterium]|nr:glycosyltransferase [Gemmatimonadales bacterium]
MTAPRGDPIARWSITHVVAPAPFGGLEHVVQSLAAGQLAAGHSVSVIALTDAGSIPPLVEQLEAARVPVRRLACGRHYLRERRELRQAFQASSPRIVHTHGYRPDVQGGAAARQLALAVVSTVHGFTGGDIRNRFYERLQQRALRRFSAVVAVSRPLVDRLVGAGVPPNRIHLVPNAYRWDTELLPRAAARAELGLSVGPADFVVGWVGRLSREKGPDVLVEALARLPDDRARAAIIGDGPDRAALASRAAALGLADRIHWLGTVPRAARCFAAFDCLALSSRTEGTPIVLLEAMAVRLPIVASAVGGVPDVVSDGEALLVPAEDPGALALALGAVAADPSAAAARAVRAETRLRAERGLEGWLAAYDAVYRRVFPPPRSAA